MIKRNEDETYQWPGHQPCKVHRFRSRCPCPMLRNHPKLGLNRRPQTGGLREPYPIPHANSACFLLLMSDDLLSLWVRIRGKEGDLARPTFPLPLGSPWHWHAVLRRLRHRGDWVEVYHVFVDESVVAKCDPGACDGLSQIVAEVMSL
jgi:hypothetical protein